MKVFNPSNHIEMYEIIAKESSEDWKINNRSAHDTKLVMEDLLRHIDLLNASKILEVGPGNGWLIPFLPKGVEYVGVDAAPTVVSRLRKKFEGMSNIKFLEGRSDSLPSDISGFDLVICHSVFCLLPNFESFAQSLFEFQRITVFKSKIWIGECPFRDEIAYLHSFPVYSKKLLQKIIRKLTFYKIRNFRPVTERIRFKETLPTFHIPVADFKKHAEDMGFKIEVFPCVGTNFFPKTRANYLLTRISDSFCNSEMAVKKNA